jgi:cysteine-rich repeat protein
MTRQRALLFVVTSLALVMTTSCFADRSVPENARIECGAGKPQCPATFVCPAAPPGTATFCLSTKEHVCGNGVLDPGEECDDGNLIDDDACRATCVKAKCGDGVVQAGEECDDGNDIDTDACVHCKKNVCGDGFVFAGVEACDDGNTKSGDGCRGDCQKVETCGDRILDDGEACDDGNTNPNDGCDSCHATTWTAAVVAGDVAADATTVELFAPADVEVDRDGDIFFFTDEDCRIRRIDGASGIVSVAAGTGVCATAGADLTTTTPTSVALPFIFAATFSLDEAGVLRFLTPASVDSFGLPLGGTVWRLARDGSIAKVLDIPSTLITEGNPSEGATVDGSGRVVFVASNSTVFRAELDGSFTHLAGNEALGQGYSGDNGPAVSAQLFRPSSLAYDSEGNLFILDTFNSVVRKVDATGTITTVAGVPTGGSSDDGVPAITADLAAPDDIAIDAQGRLLIAEGNGPRIRRVESDGTIDTAFQAATQTFTGTPLSVATNGVESVVGDASGRVLVADASGSVTNKAGNGAQPFRTVEPATATYFGSPTGFAFQADGTVLVSIISPDNGFIRKLANGVFSPVVDPSITFDQFVDVVVAANGDAFFTGNAGLYRLPQGGTTPSLVSSCCTAPFTLDAQGAALMSSHDQLELVRVALDGTVTVVAGNETEASGADGSPATSSGVVVLGEPAVLADGTILFFDNLTRTIRVVNVDGTIGTFAGGGASTADGVPARSLALGFVSGMAVDHEGRVVISDQHGLYRIDAGFASLLSSATATVVHAFGPATSSGLSGLVRVDATDHVWVLDGAQLVRIDDQGDIDPQAGPFDPPTTGLIADGARLLLPTAMAAVGATTWVAGGTSGIVERIDVQSGFIDVVVGLPQSALDRNNGVVARHAVAKGNLTGVAFDASTELVYLADEASGVFAVDVSSADESAWSIVALPWGASFAQPCALAVDGAALLVGDCGDHVVDSVALDSGAITPLFGVAGLCASFEDVLCEPRALARGKDGALFIADSVNQRVVRVETTGTSSIVIGTGQPASAGDGSPARAFPVHAPRGLAVDNLGDLIVTSSESLDLIVADANGAVDGNAQVVSLFGTDGSQFPASITRCLRGVVVASDGHLEAVDECEGNLLSFTRAQLP